MGQLFRRLRGDPPAHRRQNRIAPVDPAGKSLRAVSQVEAEALAKPRVIPGTMYEAARRFESLWLRHIVLTRADLRGISEHHCLIEKCTFDQVDLRQSTLGFDGSLYRDCRFIRCRMRRLSFVRASLSGCSFENCELVNFDFGASSLTDCKFVGTLKTGWFRKGYMHPALEVNFGPPPANEMLRVDFSEAILSDIMFTGGVSLQSVVPPHSQTHHLYTRFPQRLLRLWQEAQSWSEQDRAHVWRFLFMTLDKSATQQDRILNVSDLQMIPNAIVDRIVGSLGAEFREDQKMTAEELRRLAEWRVLASRKEREWNAIDKAAPKPKPRIRHGRGPYVPPEG